MDRDIILSIIIPCKNEQGNIIRCLKSVIDTTKSIESKEILVIDAASSDRTIELIKDFPISIIQLKDNWMHTSSAGRYSGVINSRGKYVFIIDADMELLSGFLEKAIAFMEENENIAGVAGLGKEIYIENGKETGCCENVYRRNRERIEEVDYLGAAALFRRSAISDAGNFDPYLYSQEELDLCQRLRRKKYKVFSLPYSMVLHYAHPAKSMKIFAKQLRVNRFTGIGQIMRKSIFTGYFLSNLIRFKKFVMSFVVLAVIAVVFLFAIIDKNIMLMRNIIVILLFVYLYLVAKKKSLQKAFLSIIKGILILSHIVKGFLIRPVKEKYPEDINIIKKAQ